ncbi:signal peptide prediction [Eleftheria terrae]|uniref:signal peptide prediction n=1 Tax=Eleftheria terrae TaxID=1597781 RepID=UPI00263BCFB1|nr:signal peptide prediction [Eleftheria terrae]WKB50950.1 signal peptide prediction [Eleftheria terrae]
MKPALRLLRYAWAAPASAVGLLLALPLLARGARAAPVQGVLEIAGGPLAAWQRRLPAACRFAAITFGHVVIGLDHRTLAACREHEQVHVRQYERLGPLFFPLYLGSSLWQAARGRDPYLDNCFECEAYAHSDPRTVRH